MRPPLRPFLLRVEDDRRFRVGPLGPGSQSVDRLVHLVLSGQLGVNLIAFDD
jgi:hypothetical protein